MSVLEDFGIVTPDNLESFLDYASAYMLATIETLKQSPFPELDTQLTYGDVVENYINPYIRIFIGADSKEFDYLFMLSYKSISEYSLLFNEIHSYNREFERLFLTTCIDLWKLFEDDLDYLIDNVIIFDFNAVNDALGDYVADNFYFKRKKVKFEYSLDPVGSKEDFDLILLQQLLIKELGTKCSRGL